MESLVFRYAYLDRLRSDCEYYLNHGGRDINRLEGDVENHINLMLKYYDSFSDDEKPDFISRSKILSYKERMSGDVDRKAREFLNVAHEIDFYNKIRGRLSKSQWESLIEEAKIKVAFLDDESKASDYYLYFISLIGTVDNQFKEGWESFKNFVIF